MSVFPFSAVVGQDDFKLALILVKLNPQLNGVLVMGPRGCAKSTLIRGFAELSGAESPFVNLPLGSSEEMLIGSLDLEQVLAEKKVKFQPGLLSKAHQGMLYVDEVNLLPDTLVDQLLDVASSGVNHIERDGVSHQHAAEFLLLGSMNPDEGDLRPQLLDRFGLCVRVNTPTDAEQRVAILNARAEFERNPTQFVKQQVEAEQDLAQKITEAQQKLVSVSCSQSFKLQIAERAIAAQVEGLRADIVWYQAALAHAAWQERDAVTQQDIDTVEAFVLEHRANQSGDSPPNTPPPSVSKQSSQQPSAAEAEGDWGAMPPQQQKIATQVFDLDIKTESGATKPLSKTKQLRSGRSISSSLQPNWFRSLLKSKGEWPITDWVFNTKRQTPEQLNLVLLDSSASLLSQGLESQAKALVLELAKRSYVARQPLHIFSFGNQQVEQFQAKKTQLKKIEQWLQQLPVAGGTPLLQALTQAQTYLKRYLQQHPATEINTYLITDGRSKAQLTDINLPGTTAVFDVEQGLIKRGRGQELAEQLQAEYTAIFA